MIWLKKMLCCWFFLTCSIPCCGVLSPKIDAKNREIQRFFQSSHGCQAWIKDFISSRLSRTWGGSKNHRPVGPLECGKKSDQKLCLFLNGCFCWDILFLKQYWWILYNSCFLDVWILECFRKWHRQNLWRSAYCTASNHVPIIPTNHTTTV